MHDYNLPNVLKILMFLNVATMTNWQILYMKIDVVAASRSSVKMKLSYITLIIYCLLLSKFKIIPMK